MASWPAIQDQEPLNLGVADAGFAFKRSHKPSLGLRGTSPYTTDVMPRFSALEGTASAYSKVSPPLFNAPYWIEDAAVVARTQGAPTWLR